MEMENDLTIRPGVHAQEMGQPRLGSLLVVDDQVDVLNPLCEILSKFGYDATGVTSASEALKELKNQSFDLLLTDLIMPEMDGVSLLKTALEMDPQIVASHHRERYDPDRCGGHEGSAFDYVLKPVEFRTLMPILSRAMMVRRLKTEKPAVTGEPQSPIESAGDVIYTSHQAVW